MIRFEIIHKKFILRNLRLKKRWIESIAKTEKKKIEDLSVILCDDDFLLDINRKYLNHHYYTDTITFDYSDTNSIFGDIYISIDRVFENSDNFLVLPEEELLRVIAHGTLHLCGYTDDDPDMKKIMTSKEDYYINKYKEYQADTNPTTG